jgi:uncharacterized oxidoreductase
VPTVAADRLLALTQALFEAAGVPAVEAAVVGRSLVESNLRGHDSHGVMRIPQYLEFLRDGKVVTGASLEVLDESPVLLAADAGWGFGQVQAHRLLDRLVPKAKALGVAAGSLRRCGHTGRLGEYAERAAGERMAFIGTVNSHGGGHRVAPPGGTQGRLSTNPLCIGAPTNGPPLVLDIGTSVCAEGKVRVCYQKGERVPEGWLLDADGRPTTDPSVLYTEPRGTILPLGGAQAYKGFGLSLLLDALAGGLSGGACSRTGAGSPWGNTVLLILLDVNRFGGANHFMPEVAALAGFVRDCPRADGVTAILLPGDPERAALERRRAEGIPIPDGLWKTLGALAAKFNVALPG